MQFGIVNSPLLMPSTRPDRPTTQHGKYAAQVQQQRRTMDAFLWHLYSKVDAFLLHLFGKCTALPWQQHCIGTAL